MKFWRNKKTAAAKDLKSKAASESREYVAESLEARILYSGAPMDTAVPDTSGDTTAESQSSTRFSSIDDFESAGESAIPKRMSSESSEEVILSNFENLSPLEITELAQVAIEQWKSTDLSEHQFEVINQLEASLVEIESLSGPANWESDQQSSGTFDYGRTTSIIPEPSVQHGVELISDLLQEISDPITLERLAIEQIASRTVATNLPLTYNTLDFIADAAERTWTSTGLTDDQIAALGSIEYHIADLDGARLGYAEGSHIYIDRDAAGLGWFIDSTPDQDEEFGISGSSTFTSATDPTSVAYDNVDLLSVILHEQGHVLGLDHDEDPDSLMDDTIGKGERHRPDSDAAIGATPGSLEGIHYVSAPIANNDGGGPFTVSEDGILETKIYSETVIASDPLIYWQLEEDDKMAGQIAINSATGPKSLGTNGNALYGGTVDTAPGATFQSGNGATFNGSPTSTGSTGDQVTLNPVPAGFPTTELSYEIWVKSTNSESGDGIVSYDITGQGNEALLFNQGNLTLYIDNSSQASGVSVNDGKWHHVVVNWRSVDGLLEVYKDGILGYSITGFKTGTTIGSGGSLILGQEQDRQGGGFDNGQNFRGDLDEFALYDRILSAEEIQTHFISTNLLANDTDIDGDALTIDLTGGNVVTSTRGATVTLQNNGEFSYDPTGSAELQGLLQGQSVTDTFTYTVTDETGTATDTATVSVIVNGANDAPFLVPDSASTFTEGASPIVVAPSLTLSDPDANEVIDADGSAGLDPTAFTASAEIISGFIAGQDTLGLAGALNGVTANITANGARIDFTAMDANTTMADFQAALRLVTFENLSDNPNESIARHVVFNFNDGVNDALGAEKIGVFDFNDGNTVVDDAPTALSISDISVGTGAQIKGIDTSGYSTPILRVAPLANMTSSTLSEAITKDIYFEFSVGANGETYSLSNLAFELARGGSGGTRGYAVRSSVDGYTADLAVESNVDPSFSRNTQKNITVPLSGSSHFSNLTSDVTFRVYFHTPETGNEMDIDNLVLEGFLGAGPTSPKSTHVSIIPSTMRRKPMMMAPMLMKTVTRSGSPF